MKTAEVAYALFSSLRSKRLGSEQKVHLHFCRYTTCLRLRNTRLQIREDIWLASLPG